MSDKIKRLAKNLSELSLAAPDSLQEIYIRLTGFMSKQSDYFDNIGTFNIIKLLFYIWSYKHTGGFERGDKMLNEIAFAILITTEGESHIETCDDCGGDGYMRCDNCDGTGKVECEECNGNGDVECYRCEGEGKVNGETCDECGGAGEYGCSECDSEGEISCPMCDEGSLPCERCDGDGEINTGEKEYKKYYIVTWSKLLKDRCEITQEDSDITMSEYDFDRLRDKYVVLSLEDKHDELQDFVEDNEMYCVFYDDNPTLKTTRHMEIYFTEPHGAIKNYIV